MLPFLTLAFICGLTLGSLIPHFPFSILTVLGMAAVGLTLLEANRRVTARRATAWFGCLLLGIVYWFVVVESPLRPHVEDQKPEIFQACTGRIIAPVQVTSDRLTALVHCEGTGDDAVQPLVIRLTWRSPDRELFEGDRIAIRAKFRTPSGSLNPGGFNYAAYLERQGIDAVATVNGIEAVEVLEPGRDSARWAIWNRFDQWRAAIRRSAVQSLAQPALGLYLGVMIGERGYLDPEVRDQFMVTGTVHLLSISGSHLGLVAMLSFLAVRRGLLYLPAVWLLALSRTITPTRVAAVATVIPVTIYACLAGAEVATVRSLLMVLVALMAKWLGYEQRMFHALAAAALAIVLHDPQAIYDISFQLSFLSVCAVAWWLARSAIVTEEEAPSPSRLSRTKQWTWEVLVMSALVTLTTIPLVTYYFNQLPWLGLLTNVVAVPIMGGVLVPMGLFAILSQSVFGGDSLPFADAIQWPMDMLVSALRFVSLIPGAEWHVAAPSIPTMVVFYGCLAALSVGSVRRSITWIAGIGLLVLLSSWIWSPRLWLDGDRFRITFLDVSQGDSAVLELPDGEVVLIDGGATYERFDMGRGVVAPYLWNRGIRSIDYVIATHPQLDHVGGLAYVLRHFNVRHFWGLGEAREEAFYQRLQEALAQRGLTEEVVREEQDTVVLGDCRLEVLNPSRIAVQQSTSGRRLEGRAMNNRSIVTQLSCGAHKVLFAADVEQEALSRLIREDRSGRADLVKVPHHGAAGSLHEEWLERVHPRYAVISVGRHNPYGHPVPAVLQAYAARGITLYRTDRDGGVWVTGARSQPALHVHRTIEEAYLPCSFGDRFSACERSNWKRLIDRWQE
jgi:competence protein ComEC